MENVDRFCDWRAIGRLVNVGEHRQSGFLFESAENAAALFEAGTAKAVDRRAVCLVVGGFKDVGNAEIRGNALDGVRHFAYVGFALDDAGPGNEKKPVSADGEVSDVETVHRVNWNTNGCVGQHCRG